MLDTTQHHQVLLGVGDGLDHDSHFIVTRGQDDNGESVYSVSLCALSYLPFVLFEFVAVLLLTFPRGRQVFLVRACVGEGRGSGPRYTLHRCSWTKREMLSLCTSHIGHLPVISQPIMRSHPSARPK